MKGGYLGPKGSFSEETALSIWNSSDLVPYPSFFRLFEALNAGEIQKVIVPIENSIEGEVNLIIDWLLGDKNQFSIEREIVWPIRQNLIGFGRLADIETVYSHPQALGQCRKLLNQLQVTSKDINSTSKAIQLIAIKKNPKLAAIGSRLAAEYYNVPIVKEDISDISNNETRFIVLGSEPKGRTGKDKTSLAFDTGNKPGALCKVLEVFAGLQINMTMIISRPSKTEPELGKYIFFVDIEVHQEDKKFKDALKSIENKVSFLRVFGSYPKFCKEPRKTEVLFFDLIFLKFLSKIKLYDWS